MQNLILQAALGAAILASAAPALAASDYLLELDGIKGESSAKAAIQDFRWSNALAGPAFDPYQPAFAGGVRVATGDLTGDGRWDLLVLTATDPDDGSFFRYELKDVLVSSYQTSGHAAADSDHKDWIIIESMSSPLMRWAPPTATGGRDDWIEGRWDDDSGRFIGDPAVLGAFDDLGAVRWADGSLAITAAVPEPGTWALMLLGTAALVGRRRQLPARQQAQ